MPQKINSSEPKTAKILQKQHKWRGKILSKWNTLKDFCKEIGIEWDCFREYRRFPLTDSNTKLVEDAIRTKKS